MVVSKAQLTCAIAAITVAVLALAAARQLRRLSCFARPVATGLLLPNGMSTQRRQDSKPLLPNYASVCVPGNLRVSMDRQASSYSADEHADFGSAWLSVPRLPLPLAGQMGWERVAQEEDQG